MDRAAQDQIEALRQAVTGLDAGVVKIKALSPSETWIISMIRHRSPSVVRKTAICDALYALRPDGAVPADDILKVFICKARRKLERHGIEIITHWGIGYSMPATSAAKWDELAQ